MYSITKNGVCAKHLCVIDEVNKTVSTTEDGLVFDFGELSGWSFKTGDYCTFKTSWGCTFKTGDECTFNAGAKCTFKTGYSCTFNTCYSCTFDTGNGCTFKTGSGCTFKVDENCSLIRYDVRGITELPVNQTVKLRGNGVSGYEVISDKKKVTLELTDEQIEDLRKQGIDI